MKPDINMVSTLKGAKDRQHPGAAPGASTINTSTLEPVWGPGSL
jgi:hypothetical protein